MVWVLFVTEVSGIIEIPREFLGRMDRIGAGWGDERPLFVGHGGGGPICLGGGDRGRSWLLARTFLVGAGEREAEQESCYRADDRKRYVVNG